MGIYMLVRAYGEPNIVCQLQVSRKAYFYANRQVLEAPTEETDTVGRTASKIDGAKGVHRGKMLCQFASEI